MRVFSCFTCDDRSSVPSLAFVFDDDEIRARLLARKLLAETPGGSSIEICENGRRLAVETWGTAGA